jgi:predicted DsbA family dithiol-disulfide isomerase
MNKGVIGVKIDVYMDTICPWCRMGTSSLFDAMERLPQGKETEVRWHAFQLNPHIGPEGEDYREVMIRKLGGPEQFAARLRQYNEYGKIYGLNFNMEFVSYTPNTTLSHQLIAITPVELQKQLIDMLYTAYFEKGINIGDIEELVRIGQAVGLPNADELHLRLTQGAGLNEVQSAQSDAQRLGIKGVPFFVFNEKFSLSGLHSPDDFMKVFDRVMQEN